MTIRKVFDSFLEAQEQRLKPRTYSDYETVINLFARCLQWYAWDTLPEEESDKYKEYEKEGKEFADIYGATGDYAGIVDLLDMRLTNESRLDFGFYQEDEEKLREDDWSDFEKKFIARVRKKEQPYQFHRDNSLLAQIYDYKGSTDDLWKTVQDSSSLLMEYEGKLAPIYPAEYLEQYQKIVARYIKNRGRDNYRSAAQYAERIKRLYRNVLKQPEVWETYVQQLRATNKNLPAMQGEFRHL